MPDRTFSPRIPRDLEPALDLAVLDWIDAATRDSADKDARIRAYRQQYEGVSTSIGPPRWQGASRLVDPITREQVLVVVAALCGAVRQLPYWLVEAVQPGDEEPAKTVEQWLNAKAVEARLPETWYEILLHATLYPAAPLYVGWRQDVYTDRFMGALDAEGNLLRPEEQPEGADPEAYTEQPAAETTILYDGVEFRVPHPADFYLYPANAESIDAALAVIERMHFTAADLWAGVRDQGWDRAAVVEMIRQGPTGTDSGGQRKEANQRDGVDVSVVPYPEDGYWECYQVIGRLPGLFTEGEPDLPDALQDGDWVQMVCPATQTVFKRERCPYPLRPYVLFRMLPSPGRIWGGDCIPSLLEALQEAATANGRFFIDSLDLAAAPAMKLPTRLMAQYGNIRLYPGARFPVNDREEAEMVQPLVWDKSGLPLVLQLQQMLEARSSQLVSGQALQLQNKVRKAGEIQANLQSISSKTELYLGNIQATGMERLATLLIALHQQHVQGEDVAMTSKGPARVTPQDLKRHLRFIPHANTADSNPQARIEKDMALAQVVRQSPLYGQRVQGGDLRGEYALMRRIVEDFDVRDPETLIGPEPPSPEQIAMMQQAMAAQQQMQMLAGGGMPGAPGQMGAIPGAPQPLALPAGPPMQGMPPQGGVA